MHYAVEIKDGAETQDTTNKVVKVDFGQYEVVTPLFKNGKLYKKGDIISLEEKTAERFIEAGNIKKYGNKKNKNC